MKSLAEMSGSFQMTRSLDWTPVWGSIDAGTVDVPNSRSIRPSLYTLAIGEKSWASSSLMLGYMEENDKQRYQSLDGGERRGAASLPRACHTWAKEESQRRCICKGEGGGRCDLSSSKHATCLNMIC